MKYILLVVFPVLLTAMQDDLATSIKRGKVIYEDYCITCHLDQGQGVPGEFPPLAQSDYLLEKTEDAIRAVKFGQKGEIVVNEVTYDGIMTPLYLDDEEVRDVMNFVLNSWGNTSTYVSLDQVQGITEEE